MTAFRLVRLWLVGATLLWLAAAPVANAGMFSVTPVRIHSFGSVKGSTPERRQAWLQKALALGRAA